ncbi:N-acetyltransferase [Piedraia hortae CBS 480.64]|uniref:N-acetyltransferase n=1 Tax=Piedraia hortae CBS 480.64 TaxID=1314780 RepID=A0A6A7C7A6_9PEZI|nr:N-acetyltransferase [Piedraia hortae CBS 480.64]
MSFVIKPVSGIQDLQAIKSLFISYAEWLNIDLSFQGFANELDTLPGKYSPPMGALLLARALSNSETLGCVCLRPLSSVDSAGELCEMKRLYVLPNGRGQGIGRALANAVIDEAKTLGYRAMRLDTLDTMTSALALYRSLGFVEIPAYYPTPLKNTVFLELTL